MSEENFYDVLVVGGGMAGLSTAYHLLSDDKFDGKVGLLEARSRFGGRINGAELMSTYVELGANWIHGIMGNPICDLALKHKLVDPLAADTQPSSNADTVQSKRYFVCGVASNGQKVPINTIEEVYNAYFWFTKQCDAYHGAGDAENMVINACNNSLGRKLINDVEQYLKTKVHYPEEVPLKRAIFTNLLQREACISGSHTIEDVSLKDFGSYEELPGGNLVITGGYGRLLSVLLNTIETTIELRRLKNKESRLQFTSYLEHKVAKIKWSGQESHRVQVVCANGAILNCNHLVCTLPLGVLKADAAMIFEPPLPKYKLDCIQKLGFSVVDKIFLEFRHKLAPDWLDPMINELLLFWPEDDPSKQNEPLVLKEETPKKWWKTIYSFSRISDRCLMGWVSGEEAKLVEQLDAEEVGRVITEQILRPFLNKPNFPEPESVVVTKWWTDPFSHGSYTYVPTNGSVRDIEFLSQPIYSRPTDPKPVLAFAGESTHPSFYSTTHGAFLSGRKAASYFVDVVDVE